MSDAEESATQSRNSRRATAFLVTALLLLVWSILANQWKDKDCSMFPTSYQLVITHGTPDHYEGCDEYGDYTDDYDG
jgi:hypothetical protein